MTHHIKQYKKPESVLVVIFCETTQRCLMLQRQDDINFWQSVTGSMEDNELPFDTAVREVKEETGIDIISEQLHLIDVNYCTEFDIFPQFKHRYAPDITINKEHWFYLPLPSEIEPILTEHLAYQWLPVDHAVKLTVSPNNGDAIQKIKTLNIANTIR